MQSAESQARLAVFDRDLIAGVIHDLYRTRAEGKFELFRRHVAPHAVFEYIGDPRDFPYAGRVEGLDAIIELHQRVNTEIEIISWKLKDLVIDANQAFSSRKVAARHRGTGIRTLHEIWDFWRFENGLVVRSKKLVDIAGYERLQGIDRDM